jgi:hypothetical protein
LDLFPFLAERLLVLRFEGHELFVRQGLPLSHGDGQEANGRHLDGKTLPLGIRVDARQDLVPLALDGLDQFFFVRCILVALKGGADLAQRRGDQALHVGLERPGPFGRQPEGSRTIGIAKVVDVAPAVGHGLVPGPLFQKPFDGRRPPRAGQAGHVNVEAGLFDSQAKVQGLDRPFLADDRLQDLHLPAAGALQQRRIANLPQLLHRYFDHFRSPSIDGAAGRAHEASPGPTICHTYTPSCCRVRR